MRPGDIASIKAIQIPYGRLPPSFDIVPENGPVKEQQALDTDPDPRITSVSSKPGCSSLAIQSSSRTPAVPHTASSSMAAGALTSSASIKIRQKSMRLSSKSSPTVACPNPNMKVHPDDLIESASMPDISLMSLSESARAAQDAQAAQDAGIASCSICTVQAPVPEVAAPLLSPKLASTSTTLSQTASSAAVTESSRRSVGFHSSTGNRSSRHSAHRIIYQDDLDNNRVQLPKHGDYEIVPGSSEDGLLGATVGAGGASDAGGSEEAYLAQEAQRNRVVIRPSLSTGRADIFPAGRRSNVTTPVTIGGGNGGLTVRVVHAQPSPLPRTQGAYSALPSSSYTSTARRTKASGQTGSSVPPTLKRKGEGL
ncbi:hypothetical protein BGZ73_003078 [Actinomortierella ambigua]|nr:hypothetical protein BGZ73_003078 [Actinomortierella ambigua]